jgi:hypothetical protein
MLGLASTHAFAICENPDDPYQVLDFHLELDPADWEVIRHDLSFDIERPALFWCGDEEPIQVSLRRKPTIAIPSDDDPRKVSLKIDIDEYLPDQEWHTRRKLSLENGEGSALIDEGFSWLLMARAGLITGGVSWVRVHVNGTSQGIYTRVEQIDKSYLRRHLGEDDGFLYKEGDQRTRVGETDPYAADLCYEPFDDECEIPDDGYASTGLYCDMPQLMGLGAVNALLVNDDGLLAKENNHWWYNSERPRLYFAWDLDTVMRPSDVAEDPHDFGHGPRQFQTLLLNDPRQRALYDRILLRLISDSCQADVLDRLLLDLEMAIGPAIAADPLNDLEGSVAEEFASMRAWLRERVELLPALLPPPALSDLVINEILAANRVINRDQGGEHADWVELYNRGLETESLAGLYLSDDPAQPLRWALPPLSLEPGGHLLVWCDGDTAQGALHAGFQLDREGERVGLYRLVDGEIETLDYIWFAPQETDLSFGRLADGSPGAITLTSPTPGAENIADSPLLLTLPDLPQEVHPGETATIWVRLENSGEESAAFDRALMTIDGPLEHDRLLYIGAEVPLAAGEVLLVPVSLPIPPTAPLGSYTLGVTVFAADLRLAGDAAEVALSALRTPR